MKKVFAGIMILSVLLGCAAPSMAADERPRDKFMAFIAGCCFGVRAGAAYNDGKDIHWREWATLIPGVGSVVQIWNGIDSAKGVRTADYAALYGATYY